MNTDLKQNVINTFNGIYRVLSSYRQDQIDTIPFEGSWTAGQVCEHLTKANSVIPRFCNGKTEVQDRRPDEKLKNLYAIFTNYAARLDAPSSVLPIENEHSLDEIGKAFKKNEEEIIGIIETMDLSPICLDFEFRGFGHFSRLEWIHFGIVHSARHTHQLENILQKLNAI